MLGVSLKRTDSHQELFVRIVGCFFFACSSWGQLNSKTCLAIISQNRASHSQLYCKCENNSGPLFLISFLQIVSNVRGVMWNMKCTKAQQISQILQERQPKNMYKVRLADQVANKLAHKWLLCKWCASELWIDEAFVLVEGSFNEVNHRSECNEPPTSQNHLCLTPTEHTHMLNQGFSCSLCGMCLCVRDECWTENETGCEIEM